jgi:hypothetical protein
MKFGREDSYQQHKHLHSVRALPLLAQVPAQRHQQGGLAAQVPQVGRDYPAYIMSPATTMPPSLQSWSNAAPYYQATAKALLHAMLN